MIVITHFPENEWRVQEVIGVQRHNIKGIQQLVEGSSSTSDDFTGKSVRMIEVYDHGQRIFIHSPVPVAKTVGEQAEEIFRHEYVDEALQLVKNHLKDGKSFSTALQDTMKEMNDKA